MRQLEAEVWESCCRGGFSRRFDGIGTDGSILLHLESIRQLEAGIWD
ncbi:MAG: hypothetical protein MI974_19535 [Chitinophagales bacterium]|nr:hypothetical protein [Chitinophagales bacterium]